MSLAITLNIILAVLVIFAVVAPLAWAIRSAAAEERVLTSRARGRRAAHAASATARPRPASATARVRGRLIPEL